MDRAVLEVEVCSVEETVKGYNLIKFKDCDGNRFTWETGSTIFNEYIGKGIIRVSARLRGKKSLSNVRLIRSESIDYLYN